MLFDVVSARHIKDYELEIEFEDGSKGDRRFLRIS